MFYTVDEVAKEWRVDPNTVYRWIAGGKLRANKIGGAIRISEEAKKEFEITAPSKSKESVS